MAAVPRIRKIYIDMSEEFKDQKYFGVVITPREHHFTKTDSPMLVEGEEMSDRAVAKYLQDHLRSPSSDSITFSKLLQIQVSELFSKTENALLTSRTLSG